MSLHQRIVSWLDYLMGEVSGNDEAEIREELRKFEDYVLVHKSRIGELIDYSKPDTAYRIKVGVEPAVRDLVHDHDVVRNCPSKEALERFLKDRIQKARKVLIETLEQPFVEGETP